MAFREKTLKSLNWEYIIPLLASVFLLVSCTMVSSKKFFWNDELLSFFLINDRSFLHMIEAWGDKFNQAPPLYFMLGWLWDKIFGSTDTSLRVFSSVTICISFTLIWITLRRTYHFWAVSLGTLGVFCLSDLVLYHNAEVRMYGLFSAVCALGFLLFDTINRREQCSWTLLIVNCLAHAAIVLTHLYGLLYSGAILVSFVLVDRLLKRFRSRVYLSILSGWLFIVPLIPTIIEQSNNDAKWFSATSKSKFLSYLIVSPNLLQVIIAFWIISAFLRVSHVSRKAPSRSIQGTANTTSEASLLILAATFLGAPFLAGFITLTIKPILNDRYLIPTITISWSILLTYLASLFFPSREASQENFEQTYSHNLLFNSRNIVLSALVLLLLIYPIRYAQKAHYYSQRPGASDPIFGYADLPIAMEAGHDFLPRLRYSSNPTRYFHIRDWEIAVKNTKSVFATGDYTHLEALNRHYPFIQSIQSQEFLRRHDRFLVFNESDQKWFEWRIKNNPKYQVKSLGIGDQGEFGPLELFLVELKK